MLLRNFAVQHQMMLISKFVTKVLFMTRTVDFAQTQRLSERVSQVRNFLEQLSPALASKETSALLTAVVS